MLPLPSLRLIGIFKRFKTLKMHSLQSLQYQAHHFQHSFKSTRVHFIKAMLPFSLISLLGFGTYIFFIDFKIAEAFILLSLISLPHIVVMHRLYDHAHEMSGTTEQQSA
jgi:beta-carotene 15,15'-dioxygenase